MTEEDESSQGKSKSLKSKPLGRTPFWLGEALIDPDKLQVTVDHQTKTLEPRAMSVLVFLAHRGGDGSVVPLHDIVDEFWANSNQGDGLAHRSISLIRTALGDKPDAPVFIQTEHRRGYRLLVDVRVAEDTASPGTSPPTQTSRPWLLLAAAAVVAAVIYVALGQNQGTAESEPLNGSPYSIAILAFDDSGVTGDLGGLGELVAEDLIYRLGMIQRFDVVSSRTAFSQSYREMEPIQLGDVLNVRHVLDGRVTSSGDVLELTVALTETHEGHIRWSNRLNYGTDDMSNAAREISRGVARALEVVLETREQEALEAEQNRAPGAFENYAQARARLRGARDEKKLNQAVDLFSEAIQLDPDYAAARVGLCQSYVALYAIKEMQNHYDQATKTCNDVIGLRSTEARGQIALGTLYRARGDHDAAITTLKSVVDAFPRNTEALVELGDTYVKARRYADAEKVYLDAVDVAPNEYDTQAALGLFYADEAKFELALLHLRRSVPLNPDSPTPLNNVASIYYEQGDFELAINMWQRSLAVAETRNTLTNMGMAYYFLGEFKKAADHQRRALRLSGYDHRVFGRLAESLRFLPGKEAESLAMYSSAVDAAQERIASDPTDALARARMGEYLSQLGRYDEAKLAFTAARKQAPTSEQVPYMEGTAWAARGDEDETVRCMQEAHERGLPSMYIRRDPDVKSIADRPKMAEFLASL